MPLVRKPPPKATTESRSAAASWRRRCCHGSDEQRWNAARSAAQSPDGLALLSEAISRETHPGSARPSSQAWRGFARLKVPQVILNYLRSDDSNLRTAALDALRAMPDAVANFIPRLLKDADSDVRLLACELVRHQPAADAGRMLGEVLATEPQANVCAAAIEVLAEAGGPELLPLLAACAARFPDDPFLAFALQAASERIGSQALTRG